MECIRLSELKITETRFDLSNLEDIKSLVRLELVNCGITSLENIARSTLPNIKHLDLSNNRIECISPLSKLSTLTCLNLSNNIVKDFSKVLKTVCKFKKLEWFDFRFNLSTRNFYSSNADFIEHEKMYIKTLTDVLFVKRLLYRSSILCSFKYLTWFDGSSVDLEEKRRSCFNVERLKKVMKKKSGKDVLKNPENLIAARSRIQSVALSAKDLVVDESGFSDWKPVSYPLKGAGSAVYLANEV